MINQPCVICCQHMFMSKCTQHTAHSTQHTAHSTQHTAHSTQHTAHSTQHTAHSTQHTAQCLPQSLDCCINVSMTVVTVPCESAWLPHNSMPSDNANRLCSVQSTGHSATVSLCPLCPANIPPTFCDNSHMLG